MIGNLTSADGSTLQPTPSGRYKPGTLAVGSPIATVVGKDEFVKRVSPEQLPPRFYDSYKRGVDLVLGSIFGLLLLPLIGLTALLVRMTSHGPAFYVQTRVGRYGHCFRIYKLRTMQHNAESVSGAKWAARNDPRVTWLGKILRRTHLDELPQIWNVLKGDMSLVGPRPERPEFTTLLEAAIPHYKDRMLVRPGVTGLAQVYLPPDTDIKSVQKKLIYDLRYVRTMGLFFDLRLMLATFLQAIGLPCGFVRYLLWLPSRERIEHKAYTAPQGSSPTAETQIENG